MAFQFPSSGGFTGPYAGQAIDPTGGGGGGGGFLSSIGLGGMNPISLGIGAIGGLAGLVSGSGAATKQKQILGYQRQIAEQQRNLMNYAVPQEKSALDQYASMIGMPGSQSLTGYGNASSIVGQGDTGYGHASGVAPGGTATYQNQFTPGPQNGYLMGPYAQQAYRLRSAAAEQNLQHQTQNQDQNLEFQARQMGLSTGSTAAALAREHQQNLQQYGDFQRNLAINAGQQEQQNLQNYMAMLNPGMGMGGQAANIYGQQAATYGNQAQQGFGAAGQALGNMAQYYQMQPYLNQMAQAGMNPYASSLMTTNGLSGGGYS